MIVHGVHQLEVLSFSYRSAVMADPILRSFRVGLVLRWAEGQRPVTCPAPVAVNMRNEKVDDGLIYPWLFYGSHGEVFVNVQSRNHDRGVKHPMPTAVIDPMIHT